MKLIEPATLHTHDRPGENANLARALAIDNGIQPGDAGNPPLVIGDIIILR